MGGVFHEAFSAAYPQREAEAAAVDKPANAVPTKPAAAVIGELRLALAREQQKTADLLEELRIAVEECCNNYFAEGHGERVRRLYGIGGAL